MPLSPKLQRARDQIRKHLERFDWSGLTPGRLQILQAFLKLATTEGYSAVTMRTLGKAINIKASSIYSHFPGGRDEIVTAILRWHYYHYGMAMLKEIENCENAGEVWDAIVRVRFQLQILQPENDLWDILVASDQIGKFLQTEIREEVHHWLQLCARLYEVAANDMGYKNTEIKVRIVNTLLDGANSWCTLSKDAKDLEAWTMQALALARCILSTQTDLQPGERATPRLVDNASKKAQTNKGVVLADTSE